MSESSNNNRDKMFIPFSIDRVETSRMPYFATNGKIAVMAAVIISYAFLVTLVIKSSTDMLPIIILTVMYLIVLYYMVRLFMFEEGRLKRLVRELDKHKVSTSSYFNRVQHVTEKGLIRYQYSTEIKYAYVVKLYRGSKVGVPVGFMEQQVDVLNDFLREIHSKGFSFERYEMNKSYEMSESLRNSANMLKNIDEGVLLQFHKLQVEALKKYSEGQTNEIVDYFVIYGDKLSQMRTFRDVIEDILMVTFEGSRYFTRVEILEYDGVTQFFKEVLNLKNFNILDVKRNITYTEISEIAHVTRKFKGNEEIIEVEGEEVDKEYRGAVIEDSIEKEEKRRRLEIESKEKEFNRRYNRLLVEFERGIINKEEMKQKEFEIYDSIFEEGDIDELSPEMFPRYQTWSRVKKAELEAKAEEMDIFEIEELEEEVEDYGVDLDALGEEENYLNLDDIEGKYITLEGNEDELGELDIAEDEIDLEALEDSNEEGSEDIDLDLDLDLDSDFEIDEDDYLVGDGLEESYKRNRD